MLTVIRRVTTQYRSPLACCSIPSYLLLFTTKRKRMQQDLLLLFPFGFVCGELACRCFFSVIEGISML